MTWIPWKLTFNFQLRFTCRLRACCSFTEKGLNLAYWCVPEEGGLSQLGSGTVVKSVKVWEQMQFTENRRGLIKKGIQSMEKLGRQKQKRHGDCGMLFTTSTTSRAQLSNSIVMTFGPKVENEGDDIIFPTAALLGTPAFSIWLRLAPFMTHPCDFLSL